MESKPSDRVVTKSQLTERLSAKHSHLATKDVEVAVKSLLEYLVISLIKGKRIEVRGFGSFSLRHRKARIARNPKTGELVAMIGKSIPCFKPGKPLRERIKATNPFSHRDL